MKQKCAPFEVLGDWLARLSMWHIGTADTMFAVESTESVVWNPTVGEYVLSFHCNENDVSDSEWTPGRTEEEESMGEEADYYTASDNDGEYESDDMAWCSTAATLVTWETCQQYGTIHSKRKKYQQMPLVKDESKITVV